MRTLPLPRVSPVCAAVLLALSPPAFAVDHAFATGTFVSGVTAPQPLAAGDVLNINAGGFKLFDGAGSNFTNGGGTVNWNADALYLQSGVAIVNNALWNASSDDNLYYNGGVGPSFTNNGTFRKSAGAGSTTINNTVGFVNNGTLDAQTGTIAFVGGSTFNAGSVFSGAGVVNAVSGTNVFNGNFTSSNLLLSGGTHLGIGAGVGGTVTFSGGTLGGSWGIGAGQTLNAVAGGFKIIDGGTTVLTNQGTLAWNTTDLLYLQSGATLRNQALFIANQNTSVVYNGGTGPTFDNTSSGTVRAAAGVTLNINNTVGFVNNGGTLDAAAGGAIRYNSGSTFNAGTTFTGAGSNAAAGNNSFNGSFNSTNLVLESGVHTGGNAVANGLVNWTGGFLSGTWTVAAGQTLRAQSGGFKHIDGAATGVTNLGTIDWNSTDLLYLQSGATLRNQALFVANQTTSVVYNGGTGPVFENTASGTVRAAAGVTLTVGNTAGFVNNGGILDAATGGAIRYASGSTFNSGTRFTGAGSNVAAGNNSFNGGFTSANLVLESGVHTGNAAVVGGSSTVFTGGTLAGTWQVATGQTLTAGDGGFKYIDGGSSTVTNKGSIAWNTNDLWYLQSGATLANQGTLNFNGNGGVVYNGGTGPTFTNSGLIVKSGGSGTTTIGDILAFSNLGTIDVQTGTLALPSNFTNNGLMKGTGTYQVNGTLTNAGTVGRALRRAH